MYPSLFFFEYQSLIFKYQPRMIILVYVYAKVLGYIICSEGFIIRLYNYIYYYSGTRPFQTVSIIWELL